MRGWTRQSRANREAVAKEESSSRRGTLSAARCTTALFCDHRARSQKREAVVLPASRVLAARSTRRAVQNEGKYAVYVDAANPAQQAAAGAFGKAVFGPFGKIDEVKPAKIDLSGTEGHYTLSVDNGNIMQLTTEPVLGGDNRTPIAIHNVHDVLHPTVMQGKTITGLYHDGDHFFTLKDSNSYFNDHVRSKGKI